MRQSSGKKSKISSSHLKWSRDAELLGLEFELVSPVDVCVYPQYTVGLHAWFLDQMRTINPELSAYLHDAESQKPFTVSALNGEIVSSGKQIRLFGNTSYRWYVTFLSGEVTQWIKKWVKNLPLEVALRDAPLQIKSWLESMSRITGSTSLSNPDVRLSPHPATRCS